MNQQVTTGIILARTDYGEADRILTLLTPDYGKLRVMARGVRRVKSKLAGGIELFSVSSITFVRGRGELGTLVSTRLIKHYGYIVKDIERTMLGYDLIKQVNKITEDRVEAVYFELLEQVFAALDDPAVLPPLVRFWFMAQVLRQEGAMPELYHDAAGAALQAAQGYHFDADHMVFVPEVGKRAEFTTGHIKLLRLAFEGRTPRTLGQIKGLEAVLPLAERLVRTLYELALR